MENMKKQSPNVKSPVCNCRLSLLLCRRFSRVIFYYCLSLAYLDVAKGGASSADVRKQLATVISSSQEARHTIIRDAFLKTNETMRQRSFKTSFSGSTAVTVMLVGRKLICANTGDSRAIMGICKTSPTSPCKDLSKYM